MNISRVGVIGAGQMGAGIAQVFAQSGYDVYLHDVSSAQLSVAQHKIAARLARAVELKRMRESEGQAALKRVKLAPELSELGQANLIVESAAENEKIKSDIFESLTPHLQPETILTTNTSSISITRLAACTDRPERFMGLHFMNPVPVMELVELIRGVATDPAIFSQMKEIVKSLDKTVTVSQDYPGFLINRILIPMINEAVYALFEGVGDVVSIDTSLKLGAKHPMGPLELADFIGLDTCLAIMNVLNKGFTDTKYRPCPLLVKYVEAGWLGRKSSRGFYDYSDKDSPPRPTR